VVVDGAQVVQLEPPWEGADPGIPRASRRGLLVTPLYDLLSEKYEQARLLEDELEMLALLAQDPALRFRGEILLSVHRELPFHVLRPVLYTAGQAQYSDLQLVVRNPWMDSSASIEATLPAIVLPGEPDTDGEPPLQLTIAIGERGLYLSGVDELLYPDGRQSEGPGAPPALPCLSGEDCQGTEDYDWAGLNRVLGQVKDAHPELDEVLVVPGSQAPYELLVRVLDYARWGPFLPMGADEAAWQAWTAQRRELFPHEIIAGGSR